MSTDYADVPQRWVVVASEARQKRLRPSRRVSSIESRAELGQSCVNWAGGVLPVRPMLARNWSSWARTYASIASKASRSPPRPTTPAEVGPEKERKLATVTGVRPR